MLTSVSCNALRAVNVMSCKCPRCSFCPHLMSSQPMALLGSKLPSQSRVAGHGPTSWPKAFWLPLCYGEVSRQQVCCSCTLVPEGLGAGR